MSLAGIAQAGKRLDILEALRDRLAQEIDDCDNNRDLAALALRLTDVLEQIDTIPTTKATSRADEIAERRASRGRTNTARKTHA